MNLENVKFNIDTKLVLNIGDSMGKTNALRAYNELFGELDMNAIMFPVEVKKGELPQFMEVYKMLHIRYTSPTIPHKRDIIPLLGDVDENSRIFQSVNVVCINGDGTNHSMGMDGKGALNAVLSSGVQLAGKEALMLGSGSISGVIGLELPKHGIRKLTISNRTVEKAQEIADILSTHTSMETKVPAFTPENLDQAVGTAQLFLQVTPLGMAGYGRIYEYLGFVDHLPKDCVVLDVVTNPVDTFVISVTKARGLKTVPGLKMLAGQMGVIFRFMFGVELAQEDKNACTQGLCQLLGVTID